MDVDEIDPDEPAAVEVSCGNHSNGDRLRRLLTLMADNDDGHISPKVAQKHICEPTDGKYSVSNALELFECAQQLGFGETVDQTTSTNRRVKKFRKTPYDLLSAEARKSLRDMSYRGSLLLLIQIHFFRFRVPVTPRVSLQLKTA